LRTDNQKNNSSGKSQCRFFPFDFAEGQNGKITRDGKITGDGKTKSAGEEQERGLALPSYSAIKLPVWMRRPAFPQWLKPLI
jgi:hypothetical protein